MAHGLVVNVSSLLSMMFLLPQLPFIKEDQKLSVSVAAHVHAYADISGRANDGASVRRVFSSAPRDARYHMLNYLAENFTRPVSPQPREPRAAFILNRFSRTSTIMFATNGIEQILGLKPASLSGKSFYHCIADSCLTDAVRVMESAKGNDSIAYMRFFFRDPNRANPTSLDQYLRYHDSDVDSDIESEDGGVALSRSSRESSLSTTSSSSSAGVAVTMGNLAVREQSVESNDFDQGSPPRVDEMDRDRHDSAESSGNSTNGVMETIFDTPMIPHQSSESSYSPQSTPPAEDLIEVEAVISCTSDGLVVVLRSAHNIESETGHANINSGIFASPWATVPILPPGLTQASFMPNMVFPPQQDASEARFMSSIKDIAVFAWSLTGINGSIVDHATGPGKPTGEALPPGGLPIWDPNAPPGQNDMYNGFAGGTHRPIEDMDRSVKPVGKLKEIIPVDGLDVIMGETSTEPNGSAIENTVRNPSERPAEKPHQRQFARAFRDPDDGIISSSDEEVLWKRVKIIPSYSRPKRKASYAESSEESDGGAPIHDRRRRKLVNGNRKNT